MLAVRFQNRDTSSNLRALIDSISHTDSSVIRLYATPTTGTGEQSPADGPENNFPLLAALVEYPIPHVGPLYVVFDGLFLLAAREPRYLEIKELLDFCMPRENIWFARERAPFTSALSAEDAATALLGIEKLDKLNNETRPIYFSLLSTLSEKSFLTL